MRVAILFLILACGMCAYGLLQQRTKLAPVAFSSEKTNANQEAAKIDFATQIKPILQQRCQPCHFSGGNMYARLPFDRPETIKTLGAKLFTRLKDEKEQELIRKFLAQR
jgi:hypothetical protein